MKTNVKTVSHEVTHEGGKASIQKPLQELERAVATCLLWENTFYEKGDDIAARIADLVKSNKAEDVAALAVRARTDLKLRHIPLWLVLQLIRHHRHAHSALIVKTIVEVLKRPDEMTELLSLYWKEGRKPLAACLKRGLAMVFPVFSAYQLAKWNKNSAVKLRDVLFLCHAKPKDEAQDLMWKSLIDGTLPSPDTWEVALSRGAEKKVTWERLLTEKKLGDMALLMNVRNMVAAGVSLALIEVALREQAGKSKALPLRYIAAAQAAPQLASALSDAMLLAVEGQLGGSTVLLVDVSASMGGELSAKSSLTRLDAASALAILLREVCPSVRIFTFSNDVAEVPNYRGLPLGTAIAQSQDHRGTYLHQALNRLRTHGGPPDERMILVTDEQSHDGIIPAWMPKSYLINVAPYKPGLDTYNGWTRINGWSERIVDWMRYEEVDKVNT